MYVFYWSVYCGACLSTAFLLFVTVSHLSARMYLVFYKKKATGDNMSDKNQTKPMAATSAPALTFGLALVFALLLALGTLQLTSRVCLLACLFCVSFSCSIYFLSDRLFAYFVPIFFNFLLFQTSAAISPAIQMHHIAQGALECLDMQIPMHNGTRKHTKYTHIICEALMHRRHAE